MWILESAKGFNRPGQAGSSSKSTGENSAVERLVNGVKQGLGLSSKTATTESGKTVDGEIVVSAPGKVILFGEHAVVHGVVREAPPTHPGTQ
jgi:hypothetical protein